MNKAVYDEESRDSKNEDLRYSATSFGARCLLGCKYTTMPGFLLTNSNR